MKMGKERKEGRKEEREMNNKQAHNVEQVKARECFSLKKRMWRNEKKEKALRMR